MEDQKKYETKRFCGSCGLRVDGICTLTKAEHIECLAGDERTHWRLKIESVNPGTGHARTCRCDTCLEYWSRQQVEPDRVKINPEPETWTEKYIAWAEKQKRHNPRAEAGMYMCAECYGDGCINDEYPCCDCKGGSKFRAKDTIKKNNHDVDVDEMVQYDPKSRYYDQGGIEVLEIIKAKLTPEQYQGFCLGNAIKYTCRANHKGDYDKDLEKAEFYAREAR
jgi:hypothetical protein